MEEPVAIAVLPDHPTPCALKTHTREPVPVIIYNPDIQPDDIEVYDEFSVVNGSLGLMKGDDFMREFLQK